MDKSHRPPHALTPHGHPDEHAHPPARPDPHHERGTRPPTAPHVSHQAHQGRPRSTGDEVVGIRYRIHRRESPPPPRPRRLHRPTRPREHRTSMDRHPPRHRHHRHTHEPAHRPRLRLVRLAALHEQERRTWKRLLRRAPHPRPLGISPTPLRLHTPHDTSRQDHDHTSRVRSRQTRDGCSQPRPLRRTSTTLQGCTR